MANTGNELIKICREKSMKIWEYTVEEEIKRGDSSREEILGKMRKNLKVMQNAAEYGMKNKVNL